MGNVGRERQDRDYVLSWFVEKEKEARRAYGKYVEEGVDEGSRPEIVGGGLVRSLGGWSHVVSLRQERERVLADVWILGAGDFVRRVVGEGHLGLVWVILGYGVTRNSPQRVAEKRRSRFKEAAGRVH